MAGSESTKLVEVIDHRVGALAALKPIAEKVNDMHMGANDMDHDAWNLVGMAGDQASELIEKSEETLAHTGQVCGDIERIVALMQGAHLILDAKGNDRSIEEEGAHSLLSRYVPIMRQHAEDLDRQSIAERSGRRSIATEVQHG